jgi:hypothetical protein
MPHKEMVSKGIRIPSVTQVIGCLDKPALYTWYGKYGNEECNRIKRESAEFGTAVHSLIDNYIMKKDDVVIMPTTNPEIQNQIMACVQNFQNWYKNSGMEVISAEPEDAVYSKRYNFQGTWDFIGTRNGIMLPADWKTSNQLYPTVGLQLAAYAQLYGENQGWDDNEIFKKFPNGLGVRIDKKTAKVYEKVYDGLGFYFEVFKHLIHVYEFHTGTGAWYHEKESDR